MSRLIEHIANFIAALDTAIHAIAFDDMHAVAGQARRCAGCPVKPGNDGREVGWVARNAGGGGSRTTEWCGSAIDVFMRKAVGRNSRRRIPPGGHCVR
jgi:hypothetical protein